MQVASPKRKRMDDDDVDGRPRKKTTAPPAGTVSPASSKVIALDWDDLPSDDLAGQTLALPPRKPKASKKKVYEKAKKKKENAASPLDLDDDDSDEGLAKEKDDWDDLPAAKRVRTNAIARREPPPKSQPTPPSRTPKKPATKKSARRNDAIEESKAATAKKPKKKRAVPDDDTEDEFQPLPARKKTTAKATPAKEARAITTPKKDDPDARSSEPAPSDWSSSQSGRPRRKAAQRALSSHFSRPPSDMKLRAPDKEEEKPAFGGAVHFVDTWSRGKMISSQLVGLPKEQVRAPRMSSSTSYSDVLAFEGLTDARLSVCLEVTGSFATARRRPLPCRRRQPARLARSPSSCRTKLVPPVRVRRVASGAHRSHLAKDGRDGHCQT